VATPLKASSEIAIGMARGFISILSSYPKIFVPDLMGAPFLSRTACSYPPFDSEHIRASMHVNPAAGGPAAIPVPVEETETDRTGA
jgi:hypothetical protein